MGAVSVRFRWVCPGVQDFEHKFICKTTEFDVHLTVKLRAFHAASKRAYGRPRLWKDLQEDGERVSEKRRREILRRFSFRSGANLACWRKRRRT